MIQPKAGLICKIKTPKDFYYDAIIVETPLGLVPVSLDNGNRILDPGEPYETLEPLNGEVKIRSGYKNDKLPDLGKVYISDNCVAMEVQYAKHTCAVFSLKTGKQIRRKKMTTINDGYVASKNGRFVQIISPVWAVIRTEKPAHEWAAIIVEYDGKKYPIDAFSCNRIVEHYEPWEIIRPLTSREVQAKAFVRNGDLIANLQIESGMIKTFSLLSGRHHTCQKFTPTEKNVFLKIDGGFVQP